MRLHLPVCSCTRPSPWAATLTARDVGPALAVLDVLPGDLRHRLTVVQVTAPTDLALRLGALTVAGATTAPARQDCWRCARC